MTNTQSRQVELARRYVALGHADVAARSISALIRCAMRQRDIDELRQVARELQIDTHPDFIA
jgi:hypothetical protein